MVGFCGPMTPKRVSRTSRSQQERNVLLAASLLGWKSQSEMDGIRIVNPNTDETLWSYERECGTMMSTSYPMVISLYLYRYAHGIRQADGIKILDPLTGLPKWVWRSSDHFHHSQRCDRCPDHRLDACQRRSPPRRGHRQLCVHQPAKF